jgi:hypothetical protein
MEVNNMNPVVILNAITLIQELLKFVDAQGGQLATIADLRTKTPEEILADMGIVITP